MTIVQRAREFAIQKHGDQTYDGRTFVRGHLDYVVAVLARFAAPRGLASVMAAAAYLHDVLEDTDTTADELREQFGKWITQRVLEVTDSTEGKNRRERQQNTYVKTAQSWSATRLKLADRIANVEASLSAEGKSFFGMYRKEYDFFRGMLFKEGQHADMWKHLDALMAQEWAIK